MQSDLIRTMEDAPALKIRTAVKYQEYVQNVNF